MSPWYLSQGIPNFSKQGQGYTPLNSFYPPPALSLSTKLSAATTAAAINQSATVKVTAATVSNPTIVTAPADSTAATVVAGVSSSGRRIAQQCSGTEQLLAATTSLQTNSHKQKVREGEDETELRDERGNERCDEAEEDVLSAIKRPRLSAQVREECHPVLHLSPLLSLSLSLLLLLLLSQNLTCLYLFSIPQVMEEMRAEVASSKQLESKLLQALVPRK